MELKRKNVDTCRFFSKRFFLRCTINVTLLYSIVLVTSTYIFAVEAMNEWYRF